MDPQVRKKLIMPFIVFLGILAVNTNTIINAVTNHDSVKVGFAAGSSVIVLICFVVVYRNANKGGGGKAS